MHKMNQKNLKNEVKQVVCLLVVPDAQLSLPLQMDLAECLSNNYFILFFF